MTDKELAERYKMALEAIVAVYTNTNPSPSMLCHIAKTALQEKK